MSEKLPRPPETEENKEIKIERWNEKRSEILAKHGFPRHALDLTRVMDIVAIGGDKVDKSGISLVYADHFIKYEPFTAEEEFEEACQKITGYYEETQRNRIKVLDHHINELRDKIQKLTGRVWTYEPQERPGTYEFEESIGRQTIGVIEAFQPEEIKLFVASLRKRLYEQKVLPENRDKEAAGLGSPQIFEANDGQVVHIIDQLNHARKQSEDFKEEDNYWTIARPGEIRT